MKKLVLVIALVLGTVAAPAPVLSVQASSGTSMGVAQNRIAQDAFARTYLVSLVDGFSNFQLMVQEYSLVMDSELPSSINGFSAELNYDQYVALKQDERVAFVELNEVFEIAVDQTLENTDGWRPAWGLDRINQTALPLDDKYSYLYTGEDVTVYVVDGGINSTHEEFEGRVLNGYTFIEDGLGTQDCSGHGTHVAGVIGARTYGVAKNVSLVPVRMLSCAGTGSTLGLLSALEWIIGDHVSGTPAVANLSLGASRSVLVNEAVVSLIQDNVSVVAAAGNNNRDACSYSPASEPLAITVGGIDQADGKVPSSNFGSCVDVFAPGTDIVSAWYTSNTSLSSRSGTSMAAPFVAGVVAMMLDENSSLTPAQVHEQVVTTATNTPISSAGTGSPTRILFNGYSVTVEAPAETTSSSSSTTTSTTLVAQEVTTTSTTVAPTSTTSTTSTTVAPTSTTSTTSTTVAPTSTTTAAPPPAASAPREPDPEPAPEPAPVPTATTTSSTTSTTPAPAAPVLASNKPATRSISTTCKKIGSTKKVARTTFQCVKVKQVALWKPVNNKVIALKK